MDTVGELKKKLKQFTDTEEESYVKEDELCCFINMAIQKAAKIVSCLNKDYFTSCKDIDVPAGQDCISLPDDIMGTKIKKVYWVDAKGRCCKLKRLDYDCFEDCEPCVGKAPTGFQFFNKAGEGNKLYLIPACHEAGKIRMIYERQPCKVDETTSDTKELEMKECCDFIFYNVLMMLYVKEKNPLGTWAIAQMNAAQKLMEECMCPQFNDDEACELEYDEYWGCVINDG